MRICLAYDCLFPWTVGGHERYFRGLAEQLAEAGHEVTYLTRRQWPRDRPPQVDGVRVIAVSRAEPLYGADGRRRIAEAVRYGAGVGRHLASHRHAYDVVHLVSFPYFSLPAARLALAAGGAPVVVDWPEVWSPSLWADYLGVRGRAGLAVQRLCARLTPEAFVVGERHGRRLREQGMRGPITLLPAPVAAAPVAHPSPAPAQPLILFVGRMIPEKRATAAVAAIGAARERLPSLRGLLVGDGPVLPEVQRAIAELGLGDVVETPGRISDELLRAAFERATCLLAPSRREGYGLVVLEAAAAGTPSIAVRGPDNAMADRLVEGHNGMLVDDPQAATLAAAIVRVVEAGQGLRDRTAAWFVQETRRLAERPAVAVVEPVYRAGLDRLGRIEGPFSGRRRGNPAGRDTAAPEPSPTELDERTSQT
jgi:glycosyltransferase involved in cell wall biosynthesis